MKHTGLNIKIGAILAYLNIGVSITVNIFFIPFLLKNVGDSQYGLYSFATSLTSMLTILSFGMTSAYARFATIAKKEAGELGLKKINSIFFLFFLLSSFLALLVGCVIAILMFTGVIPLTSYSSSERSIIFIIFSLSLINILVTFISYVFSLNINLNMRYIWARLVTLLSSIAIPLISIPFLISFKSIVVYAVVNISVNVVVFFINALFCFKVLHFRFEKKVSRNDIKIFKRILYFSIYIFVVSIVTQIDAQADKVLLGFFANAETVAIYQLGFSLVNYVGVASTTVCSLYIPIVNKQVADSDDVHLNNTFLSVSSKMQILYIFVACGFISCGPTFIRAWLGTENPLYKYVYYITVALSLINLIPYTMNLASEIQRAMNLHKYRAFVLLASAITNIVLTIIFLAVSRFFYDFSSETFPIFQIAGCIVCTGIASLLFPTLILSIYNKRVVKLPIGSFYLKLLYNLIPGILGYFISFLLFNHILDLSSLNIWVQTIIIGVCFAFTFVLVLCALHFKHTTDYLKAIFIKKQVRNTPEQKENKKTGVVVKITQNCFVIGIDDCEYVFNNLRKYGKKYDSLFNEPFLSVLKELHTIYGVKFTLYIQNTNKLNRIRKSWTEEFKSVDWLRFGFHSGTDDVYTFIDSPLAKQDYENFTKQIIRLFGKAESIDRFVRLHCFSGSKTALEEMTKNKYGPIAYLTADSTNRLSYYLDESSLSNLNTKFYHYQDQMVFIKCCSRLDSVFNGEPFTLDNVGLPTFFHEWQIVNNEGMINKSAVKRLSLYLQYLKKNNVNFCFANEIIKIERITDE